jgi:hypothetical protein
MTGRGEDSLSEAFMEGSWGVGWFMCLGVLCRGGLRGDTGVEVGWIGRSSSTLGACLDGVSFRC